MIGADAFLMKEAIFHSRQHTVMIRLKARRPSVGLFFRAIASRNFAKKAACFS